MTAGQRICGKFLLWTTAEVAPKIPRALPPEETLASIGGDGTLVKAGIGKECV